VLGYPMLRSATSPTVAAELMPGAGLVFSAQDRESLKSGSPPVEADETIWSYVVGGGANVAVAAARVRF
jgi:hypothetical protein